MCTDPHRPQLDADALRRSLVDHPSGWFSALEVVDDIDSTNAELRRRAQAGAADRTVLLAEQQSAGRGRLGRAWSTPARTQVALSVLVRSGSIPPELLGWLPLVTGVAVNDGLTGALGVQSRLKWPNDVLVDGKKLAGILVEMTTVTGGGDFAIRLPALVIGLGLNVSLTEQELPVPHATSLALCGATTDRTAVAEAILQALAIRLDQWHACSRGSGSVISTELRQAYLDACGTIGAPVRIELPDGDHLIGVAQSVDLQGRLVVTADGHEHAVAAGDVTHVRPAAPR